MLEVLITFLCGVALDVLQVLYTASIVKQRPFVAAHLSVIYSAMAAFAVVSYVHNYYLFIPYLAGVWLGTVLGMILQRKLHGSPP